MTTDAEQDAKDAARYRFMRDAMDAGTIETMAHRYDAAEWDACVDERMAEAQEKVKP